MRALLRKLFPAILAAAPVSGQWFQHGPAADSVTVAAVGDIMAHDSQLQAAWDGTRNAYDFGPVFRYVQDLVSSADLAVGNFETTLPGRRDRVSGYPAFGAPDALAAALRDAGFDLLNTANNHCADKGRDGLIRTLDALDTLGLRHVGTYRDSADYGRNGVQFVERRGIRIAFVSYTYGTNGSLPAGCVVSVLDSSAIAADMRFARAAEPDFIVAMLHFGTEYATEPDSSQVRWAGLLFDEGADVVLGGHPHVLQRWEKSRRTDRLGRTADRLAVYSLGNFVSNQRTPNRDGGMVFFFTLRRAESEAGGFERTVENPSAVPVWVFDRLTDGLDGAAPGAWVNRFLVIPVPQWLDNYSPFDLPPASMDRMRAFLRDFRDRVESRPQSGADVRPLFPDAAP
jgi:poly-gamma-glutamate capsule biosynthesis protein CapA/YwtB (metallophosphatase superfamily)